MKNIILITGIIFSALIPASAQHLRGKVAEKTEKGEEALFGANVFWLGTKIGAETDVDGNFHLAFPDSMPGKLIVSMVGYAADTLLFTDKNKTEIKILLKISRLLKEVEIIGRTNSTNISTFTPINTEIITSKELIKAACCNLSESFETNASVDVNYTDAVSGAKQIQMLGLDGIYTQILGENLPLIRGMSSAYGLNYVPGPWVESILVTKGAGSVVNGYESITGQLNIELLEPDEADKFFLNAYGNQEGRWELNTHFANRFNPNVSTLLLAHASGREMKFDRNNDGFLDVPLTRQYNILNRWHFQKPNKVEGQAGVRAMMESRQGGQMNFNYDKDFGDTVRYGIGIDNKQIEVFTKTGFIFPDKPWKSIAFTTSERYHQQEMYFGLKKYKGEQRSMNVNGIWQTIISDTRHKIKFGPSLNYDNYKESFNDSVFKHEDIIPGGYSEYTYSKPDTTISLVVGARGDYHNKFGAKFSPRVHFKYNFRPRTALRLSAGSGWRTANIFVENASVFANSRQVAVKKNLRPEEAWNYGISFTHKFRMFVRDAYFNADFFRTDFIHQVIVDLENPDYVQFYNLNGKSFSNALQMEFGFQPMERLDVKLAYKYYDVKSTYGGVLKTKPMLPGNRALLNLAYATIFDKWKFDFTVKWFDKSRLPSTLPNPAEFQFPSYSKSYYTLNAQVTKKFKYVDVYLGGENLTDYFVRNSIIDANNPFGTNFDASLILGPTTGRLIYAGLRFSIKNNTNN